MKHISKKATKAAQFRLDVSPELNLISLFVISLSDAYRLPAGFLSAKKRNTTSIAKR